MDHMFVSFSTSLKNIIIVHVPVKHLFSLGYIHVLFVFLLVFLFVVNVLACVYCCAYFVFL